MADDNWDLKNRTKKYAISVVKLIRSLPSNFEGNCIGKQLFRSVTSVAANYRAACRARSKAEFISKIGIVIEEADESVFWLELITDLGLLKRENLAAELKEANEILAIMIASSRSAKSGQKKGKS